MNSPVKELLEHLQVVFLDVTESKKNPVMLKQAVFSFSPIFAVGDKINFKQVKIGEEYRFDTQGDSPTHRIKKLHWSIADLETNEGGRAITYLIVSLQKVGSNERVFLGPNND